MSIICGDCLEEMRKMEDNSVSAIVTNPPYGLSFMGKGWDHAVPDVNYWKEAFRICKPGSFLIAMGGARTFHQLTCAIEDAGFEIRDCISWLYGSGFPKSHNHFGIEGYGTALKPAWEPCIVAMKKCDGTFKQNAEKWGQAGINIDACRIPTNEKLSGGTINGPTSVSEGWDRPWKHDESRKEELIAHAKEKIAKSESLGRWPANVIFNEEAASQLGEPSRFFYCAKTSSSERNEGLEGLEGFKCGVGALRDSNRGKIAKNTHPTVKPIKLMEYLIKLVMPPKDGILLDPFAGSGSTILAAHRLGMKAIGIEKQPEYCEIARARLLSAEGIDPDNQLDLFETCI